MKKEYIKPEAEYISFYSEEEITADVDAGLSGSFGEEPAPGDW